MSESAAAEAKVTVATDQPHYKRIASFGDVLMMNLGIIVAGVVTGWNSSLYIGYGEYLINFALCSFAYICLSLCIAEMAGIIAFSGGSYGYCRCTLSPFIGYLVGMCDLLQSVLYTASFVHVVAVSFAISISGDEDSWQYIPLWWVAVYLSLILFALPGGRFFWNSVIAFTVLSMIMMLVYCLGLANEIDPKYFTLEVDAFAGSPVDLLNNLIVPTVCFVGVDLITLFGDEAKEPQKHIPLAMIAAIFITIGFAWWVTVTCMGVFPGVGDELINGESLFPMHYGFEHMLDISTGIANLLMAPTVYSSAMGFMFAAGRQMSSMSRSGLLPSCLSITYGPNKVPIAAFITTAVIGIITMLPVWGFDPAADDLYELSMVGACCVYIAMFWCYLVFKIRYASMERTFVNPLGIASAVYGIIFYAMVLCTVFFGQLDFNSLMAFVPYIGLSIVYYYRVVESRQFFSKDEQAKFMKAYILNANRRKKKSPPSVFVKKLNTILVALGFSEKTNASLKSMQSNNGKNSRGGGSTGTSPRSHQSKSLATSVTKHASSEGSFVASIPGTDAGPATSSVQGSNRVVPVSRSIRVAPVKTETVSADSAKAVGERHVESVGATKIHVDAGEGAETILPPVVVDTLQWSGKLMGESDSRKFFDILHKQSPEDCENLGDNAEDPDIALVTQLPEQFVRLGSPNDT